MPVVSIPAIAIQAALRVESVPRTQPPPPVLTFRPPTAPGPPYRSVFTGADLVLAEDNRRATAQRPWTILDPLFQASGAKLEADLVRRTLHGESIRLQAGSYHAEAQTVNLVDRAGVIEDLRVLVRAEAVPLLSVRAKRLELRGDDSALAEGLGVDFLGVRLVTLKRFPIQLTPTQDRESTLSPDTLPEELGIRRDADKRPFASRWDFGGGVGVSLSEFWSYDLHVAYSLLSSRLPLGRPLDHAELRSGYMGSFYSNIRRPLEDDYAVRYAEPRLALVGMLNRNKSFLDDERRDIGSRPYVLGVEFGGRLGPFAGRMQLREERIETRNSGRATRAVALGSVALFTRRWPSGFQLDSRLESVAIDQGDEYYAWVRPMVGASQVVHPNLRMAGAFYLNVPNRADPPFAFDGVQKGVEFHARADFGFGNVLFGLASRFRFDRGDFYRSQALIEFPIGAFVPWFKYDTQYGNVAFGFSISTASLDRALAPRRVTEVIADPVTGAPK